MADIVNRGNFPGDPNADTAYQAFGKANDEFAAVAAALLALGNGKQDAAANLTALAGLALAADMLPYATGPGAMSLTALTAYMRGVLAAADAAAARTALGLGTGAGDVVGPGSSTDNAAARFDLATGKLLQDSALLIADTTGALSRVGGGGVPVQGSNTNGAAAAGDVGEHISSIIVSGSAVAITNSIAANITSISLTAGDWDVWANARLTGAAATTVAVLGASISLTSATMDNTPGRVAQSFHNGQAPFVSTNLDLNVGATRVLLNAPATVYLVTLCAFSTSTMAAFGALQARRRR